MQLPMFSNIATDKLSATSTKKSDSAIKIGVKRFFRRQFNKILRIYVSALPFIFFSQNVFAKFHFVLVSLPIEKVKFHHKI